MIERFLLWLPVILLVLIVGLLMNVSGCAHTHYPVFIEAPEPVRQGCA
jgi:hypothetical protein